MTLAIFKCQLYRTAIAYLIFAFIYFIALLTCMITKNVLYSFILISDIIFEIPNGQAVFHSSNNRVELIPLCQQIIFSLFASGDVKDNAIDSIKNSMVNATAEPSLTVMRSSPVALL